MSEGRTNANRRNATLSSGPKTKAGKEKSSRNAVKHGLNVALTPAEIDTLLAGLLTTDPGHTPINFDDQAQLRLLLAERRRLSRARLWLATTLEKRVAASEDEGGAAAINGAVANVCRIGRYDRRIRRRMLCLE